MPRSLEIYLVDKIMYVHIVYTHTHTHHEEAFICCVFRTDFTPHEASSN